MPCPTISGQPLKQADHPPDFGAAVLLMVLLKPIKNGQVIQLGFYMICLQMIVMAVILLNLLLINLLLNQLVNIVEH